MMNENHDTHFLKKVRSALDQEAADLDVETRSRLRKIRNKALEQGASKRTRWSHLLRLPVAITAVGLAVAVTFTTVTHRSRDLFEDGQSLVDLEIIASGEQLELFTDLDFYFWLAEKEDHAG